MGKEFEMHWWDPRMGWGTMICGGTLGLLVLAALVVVVILLLTRSSTGNNRTPSRTTGQTPMEILQERYARGEITRDEYQEMREHLRES
jgi:putative membrane protein